MAKKKTEHHPPETTEPTDRSRIITAIRSNLAALREVLKGLPASYRVPAYACFIISLLCIIVLLTPPYDGQKSLVAFGGAILAVLVVLLIIRRGQDTQDNPPQASGPKTLRLSPQIQNAIRTTLEDARKIVYNLLSQRDPGLQDDHIRANVFFPQYGPSGHPDDYVLKIYPGLHLKMYRDRELEIDFEPGKGATGKVFASGQARVAERRDDGSGDWDDCYDITDELATIIHPELQWVISMPLKRDDGTPIGVMNIDGIHRRFNVDVLYDCLLVLSPSAIIISGLAMNKS